MAAFSDLRTMTIPNQASLLIFASFVFIMPVLWQGWGHFSEHIAVGLSLFVFGFICFACNWIGGGDAKLLAATSFWWTWPDLFFYLIIAAFLGGILAVVILIGRPFMPPRLRTHPLLFNLFSQQQALPYGLPLAIAALLTLPKSEIFTQMTLLFNQYA